VAVTIHHSAADASVNDDHHGLSRKALLNMAIDAVPTRWYVSGIELERGLSVSVDTAFFAHRAAAAHRRMRGTVLVIPQFGLLVDTTTPDQESKKMSDENPAPDTGVVWSAVALLTARRSQGVRPLSFFDTVSCYYNATRIRVERLESMEAEWLSETKRLFSLSEEKYDAAKQASNLEEMQRKLVQLSEADLQSSLDESPILLIDNLGPHQGIRTHEIAREIESFAGSRCFNGIRLVQLAVLGYTIDVQADLSLLLSCRLGRPARVSQDCIQRIKESCQDGHFVGRVNGGKVDRYRLYIVDTIGIFSSSGCD
jgi:hypothetical protein